MADKIAEQEELPLGVDPPEAPEPTDELEPEGEPEEELTPENPDTPDPDLEPEDADDDLSEDDAKALHADLIAKFPTLVPQPPAPKPAHEPEAAPVIDPVEQRTQKLMITREDRKWREEITKAEDAYETLRGEIASCEEALAEADEGSKAHAALRAQLISKQTLASQWAKYHSDAKTMKALVEQVREEISVIPDLAPYPHDYLALLKGGRITPDMGVPEILTAIHAYRAASGKATPAIMRETGKPATKDELREVRLKALKKLKTDKPGGKNAATDSRPKEKELEPAAAAALKRLEQSLVRS